MGRKPDLTEEIWVDLRRFLGTTEDEFNDRYLEIRRRLIRIFQWRGASDPDALADETIFRVAQKCGPKVGSYVGDPLLEFCGFARNVFRESLRKKPRPLPPPQEPTDQERQEEEQKKEAMDGCLDQCMTEKLAPQKKQLVLDYYRGESGLKIENRRQLAKKLGKSTNALRIEVHRIRTALQTCVFDCIRERGFA